MVAHAEDMVDALADRALYAYYDDEASPTLDELRERYGRQTRGHSADGSQAWHNWILRERSSRVACGFVQATVVGDVAELAWVVGTAYQGHGYATEAARAVRDALLRGRSGTPVSAVIAHIASGHVASESVARHLGLAATDITVDGEYRWA